MLKEISSRVIEWTLQGGNGTGQCASDCFGWFHLHFGTGSRHETTHPWSFNIHSGIELLTAKNAVCPSHRYIGHSHRKGQRSSAINGASVTCPDLPTTYRKAGIYELP
jgi:hypothetical protein